MTLRRWMWIFVAIAAGSLGLAAAGHWLLQWPRDAVHTWLGIGGGYLVDVALDCDADTLLVTARPRGPACHNGTLTCFGDEPRAAATSIAFLAKLEAVVAQRATEKPDASYTAKLLAKGINKVAQKVGEEGVETALAGVNESEQKVVEESADLLFHLLVLLQARKVPLSAVVTELERRHRK